MTLPTTVATGDSETNNVVEDTSSNDPIANKQSEETSEDTSTDNSSDDATAIPTLSQIFFDFNGSLGFVIGSSGFILSMYFVNWLPYFRYGSISWIWGCFWYSVPILMKRECWSVGNLGEFLCNALWLVGCVFGGFFDEETVENFMSAIDHLFLYGSLALLLEPIWSLVVRRGRLCCTKNEVHLDRVLELSATFFYCMAGIFGGFPPHPSLKRPGVYFWEVGSLFSFGRSFLLLSSRRKLLKAQQGKRETKLEQV